MLTISLPASLALLIDLTRRGAIGRVRMVVMTIIVGLSAAFWWPWGIAGLTAGWVSMVLASGCTLHVLCNREWRGAGAGGGDHAADPGEGAPRLIRRGLCIDDRPVGYAGSRERGDGVRRRADACAGRLLWLGEKALVVRCSDEALGVRAMTPEGIHIRPAQRPD